MRSALGLALTDSLTRLVPPRLGIRESHSRSKGDQEATVWLSPKPSNKAN